MCDKCKENEQMLNEIRKEREIKKEKNRYTFMSGGINGDSYVIDNKTGKKKRTIDFLLR